MKGEKAGPHSDLFSLGVILYEMLTGTRPFAGEHLSTVIYKILSEEPPRPALLIASLPPGIDTVVRRAMAKDPADRYRTGAELTAELKKAAQGGAIPPLPQTARPVPPATAAALDETIAVDKDSIVIPPVPEKLPPSDRFSPRHRLIAVFAVAVLALGLFYWRTGPADATSGATDPATAGLGSGALAAADDPDSGSSQSDSGAVDGDAVASNPASPATDPATTRDGGTVSPAVEATPSSSSSPPRMTTRRPAATVGAVGRVVIHTEPPGASILVDGKPTPYRTPVNFALPPGRHKITLESDGLTSQAQEIVVESNQTAEVRVDLDSRGVLRRLNPFGR